MLFDFKLSKSLYSFIRLVFLLICEIAVIDNFIVNKTTIVNYSVLRVAVFTMAICVIVCTLDFLSERVKIFFYIVVAVMFLFQILVIVNCSREIEWGCASIINAAQDMVEHGWGYNGTGSVFVSDYDAILIGFWYIIFFVFGRFIECWKIAVVVTVISVDVAVVLTYLISKRLMSIRYARITFFISMSLIGLNPWSMVPYGDVLSMCLVPMYFYLFLLLEKGKKRIAVSVILGIMIYFGYYINQKTVIIVIAILIVSMFSCASVSRKDLCVVYGVIIVTLIGSRLFIGQLQHKILMQYASDEYIYENRIDYTHYINMGLIEPYGGFNMDAYTVMFDTPGLENKRHYNIEQIKQRLQNFGVRGYFQFLLNKFAYNYTDGTFFYGGEGGFYASEAKEKCRFFKLWNYETEEYQLIYANYLEALWIICLFVLSFGGYFDIKKQMMDSNMAILKLSIIGFTFYLLLFEARSRCLYNSLPIMMILFGHFLEIILGSIKCKNIGKSDKL